MRQVRARIRVAKNIQQITKAMKMVAAAKLRRAQDRIIKMRPYSQKLTSILNEVVSAMGGELEIAYAEQRQVQNVLIVPMTSDKGLCGAFNSNIMKATVSLIDKEYKSKNVTILPLGKKAFEFFTRRSYTTKTDFYEIFADVKYDEVRVIAEYAMMLTNYVG